MLKGGMVDKQGESMVASYRYLVVSNPGLHMWGSNECDVFYQYGTQASFQYIRRIPALYIFRPKKNLRQLESCPPSSQYEWSVNGWMCCQIQPLVDQYKKPRQHQTFAIEKIRRFDRNNPIMSWGQKKSLSKNLWYIIYLWHLFVKLVLECKIIELIITKTFSHGRPHFGNAKTRRVLWLLFQESYMYKYVEDWMLQKNFIVQRPLSSRLAIVMFVGIKSYNSSFKL